MVAIAWGLLGALLVRVMRGEPGNVRRRRRALTKAAPDAGDTIDVVGPQGELLEQITVPPEVEASDAEKDDAISEEQRAKLLQMIRHDAARSSAILLLCMASVVAAIVIEPLGMLFMPPPHIAAGVMFLLGGTLCAYLLTFYSGALELLDHDYSESYWFIRGGGIIVFAILGAIPSGLFSLGAMGLAHIDAGLALPWSLGWASVYAAIGGIYFVICWVLAPEEDLPARPGPGQGPIKRKRIDVSDLVLAAAYLGMPLLLPAGIHTVGMAVRMMFRLTDK